MAGAERLPDAAARIMNSSWSGCALSLCRMAMTSPPVVANLLTEVAARVGGEGRGQDCW